MAYITHSKRRGESENDGRHSLLDDPQYQLGNHRLCRSGLGSRHACLSELHGASLTEEAFLTGFQIGTIFIPEPISMIEDHRTADQKLHDAEGLMRVWRESFMKFSADRYAEVATLNEEIRLLRRALVDALTVFGIEEDTQFRKAYIDVIKRAQEQVS